MKIESLKISHFPATRSARVLWAAYEAADCRIDVETVNLYRGVQYAPEYLARNPNHAVPTMEIKWEDGSIQTMIESVAMVTFLADAFPLSKLAPTPGASKERADYLQMMHFCGTQLDMMLWQVRCHEHLLPTDQSDARTIERYRAKFRTEAEPQLARRLKQRRYICGDDFTAADCVAGHNVRWAHLYGLCQEDLFHQYLSELSKRPAFTKAFADAANFQPSPPGDRNRPSRFSG